MARVAGVEIPNNKRSEIALTYIYGIGRSSAQEILKKAGVNFDVKVKDIPEQDLDNIRKIVDSSHEYKASYGYWLLPRFASPQRTAGARTEIQNKCTHS